MRKGSVEVYVGSRRMIPEAAQKFADSCAAECGASFIAVLLEGSFARGDNREDSDIDLFVLLDKVDSSVLDQIGSIVARIETRNELNPAVVSLAELESYPELFEYLRVKHDGVLLQGALPEIKSPEESELDIAKRIARDVLMSSRHYLAVSEPGVNFARGKLHNRNLKPLGFALRFFHLAQTGEYIRSVRDLATRYPVLDLDPVKDWQHVLQECMRVCEKIIGTQQLLARDTATAARAPRR